MSHSGNPQRRVLWADRSLSHDDTSMLRPGPATPSTVVHKTQVGKKRKVTMSSGARADSRPARIAVIGNYIPRRCGIATFTADLAESLAAEAPESEVWAAAMNDMPEGYPYPSRVHFEMNEQSRGDYRLAAEFLNINGIEVASLQHEYGIYGGPAGGVHPRPDRSVAHAGRDHASHGAEGPHPGSDRM